LNHNIPFNKPCRVNSSSFVESLDNLTSFSGDKKYTKLCNSIFELLSPGIKSFLTPSCTDSLELAALACDISPGDEVIMPSFTFVSTANAFALRGAKIIFVDIRPDTLNLDETKIEEAITSKTKAIVPVHYAGVCAEMDSINQIAKKNGLFVIEDAAQAIGCSYKGKPAGTLGHFGCFSFHETKNIHCGEGGSLLVNQSELVEKTEILREKGTNRSKFLKGQVDKYTWVDVGSSFLLSDLSAWYLYHQLMNLELFIQERLGLWNNYFKSLSTLQHEGKALLPQIPDYCRHNGHIFHIRLENQAIRDELNEYLNHQGIQSTFHYVPLHSSPAGQKVSHFVGEDKFTTSESSRLLRLPIYSSMSDIEVERVVNSVFNFFKK
jgi:dTDP-4-amino-4,6-dideoxygalactose transaminase